jgi:3-oxoacyl-[acyl-carrier-protein] synthase II
MNARIAITGIGAITPVGHTAPATFAALLRGQSGAAPLSFSVDDRFDTRIAAEVKDYDPAALFGKKIARRQARFGLLAMTAAQEALTDAGFKDAGYDPERIATIIGVGFGGLGMLCENYTALCAGGPSKVLPTALPALIPNMASGLVSMQAGALGPCYCTASACASSAHAIGDALQLLRHEVVDAVICGGAEAVVAPLALASFSRMMTLSTRNAEPTRASRPFDRERDGFVLGEGAGVLILERLERARQRGAKVYAELAGYGASADAFHVTRPEPEGRGAQLAMRNALKSAGLAPDEIDYVNAHGTSTQFNDLSETVAIKAVFGDHARKLWVSSNKSMLGHLVGAAGAVELIMSALGLTAGMVPPTINLDEPGEGCDLDYVPHVAREKRCRAVLSNSFGFGGQNASIALRSV